MTASDDNRTNSDGRSAGAAFPARSLQDAARAMLAHALRLPEEDEAADMLRAMGVESPTGADGVLLGQYLKALRGDTSAAKFVRDAAELTDAPDPAERGDLTDLAALSDEALYALAAEDTP